MSLTIARGPIATRVAAARGASRRRKLLLPSWALLFCLGLLPATSSVALPLLSIATIGAIGWSVRHHRPAHAWTWWCVLAALTLFTVGGAARVQLRTLGVLTARRSIVPELITLPGYALLVAGLVGFVLARTRKSPRRLSTIYDGLIAGLAMLACSWVYLIEPVLSRHDTPFELRVVLVCYPAMSLFLAVTTVQIVLNSERRRTPAERFLVATMSSMFVGDVLYMLAEIHVLSVPANVLDLPYLLAYVSAANCALAPSMRGFTEGTNEGEPSWSLGRVLLVALAFTVPALLVLQASGDRFGERLALFLIVIALTSVGILQILQALHAVERSEARLRFQALHDTLTGLPNRRRLEEHLGTVLERAREHQSLVGLLFLDLDRFKLINDTLGHSHGDELLIQVARRLCDNIRAEDLVSRIGGDEFLVILDSPATVEQARETANRLRQCLRTPFLIEGTEFYVTASIGLAAGDGNAFDVETLIRDADTAMYQAKEAGRDAVAIFDDSMRAEIEARVEIEHDLRHAIERNELHLVYQPVLSLERGVVLGFEALIRWAHPTLGVILPSRFIPLAEESDLIIDIGGWVLEEALRQLAICRAELGTEKLTMAVNVSAAQLRDEHLVERVRSALWRHGLPGSSLCIELTESEMMRDPNAAIAALSSLRRLNVRLALDDFGTEYSSLAYLRRLPVDILKIDYSFVDGLRESDSPSESLVSAIIAMAGALSIETIAEGVETAEQARRLARLGCQAVQGYLYARPVRGDQLADLTTLLSKTGRAEPEFVPLPAPSAGVGQIAV